MSRFKSAIAIFAGTAVAAGVYCYGGPIAACAARSLVYNAFTSYYGTGWFATSNAFALSEHAGFHVMKNILPYAATVGTAVTGSINCYFNSTPEVAEDTPKVSL